ncbi:MAG: hypothetical protein IPK62_03920 [Bacteroidetes bacterium]|nr:hypothetical protein [Bacteroidota bacterium]
MLRFTIPMRSRFLIVCILLLRTVAEAQNYVVEMVSNLHTGTGGNPRWLTVYNNQLFFFASDNVNPNKLFSMAPNGVPLLCPNVAGSAVFGDGTISTNQSMGVLNNKLYLPILVTASGRELYSYDNVNIPNLVANINPGTASSNPTFFTPYNNKLYFQAKTDSLGAELWAHDPVLQTTQCLSDINPGALHSTIAFITVYNNKLYFAGSNGNDTTAGNTGIELYVYDPVLNTINLVSDIYPGFIGSNPTALMVANNKLYFVATDPLYGKELYEYDGNNVSRLTDINPGPAQGVYTSDQSYPTFFNGKIYFAANEVNNMINLGVYDVSNNTSTVLYCAGPNVNGIPRYFKQWDQKIFFSNYSDTAGTELWATDGVNPPFQVWDIHPGALGGLAYGGYPKFFTEFNGALYFNAMNDTSSAEELFRLKVQTDTIIQPNGINEFSKQVVATVTPNPVSEQLRLHIQTSSDVLYSYQIVDFLGRCMVQSQRMLCKRETLTTIVIDFSNLAKGAIF